jgi:aryl-alcohol dehydrogenase-like predicted oxidoreductase
MAFPGTQYVLQAGLASGMSSTAGYHSSHPNPVEPQVDAKSEAYILPVDVKVDSESRVTLKGAKADVEVPYLCIGAWPWADKATFIHDPAVHIPLIKEAWEKLKEGGVTFVDTAQAYADGESERICGHLFEGMPRESFVIQTKWFSFPDLTNVLLQSKGPLHKLKDSLENLRLDYVDVYLVHGHTHPSTIATIAKGMAECVHQGLAKVVGVANYNKVEMIEMANELAKHGVPLATNQCEFSVLRRLPEVEGLIDECRRRGIVFQGYSALANGRLTGKYSTENPPPSTYRFSQYPMSEIEGTINVLRQIANERSVPMAAVALNFCINKGAILVAAVRTPEQAAQNIQALGWRLISEEIRRIESVSVQGKTSTLWQRG